MLAAAPLYASGTFWSAVISIVGILVAIAGIYVSYVLAVAKRRITYEMPVSAPLMSAPPGVRTDLRVLHGDKELADPHLLAIRLVSRGRRDIPSSSFDQDRPLLIDVGIPIIAVLETTFAPSEAPFPKVVAVGSELRIGPDLIRKRQAMDFLVLANGACARLSDQNPLIDVTVGRPFDDQSAGPV
jgi:hypothetical protein